MRSTQLPSPTSSTDKQAKMSRSPTRARLVPLCVSLLSTLVKASPLYPRSSETVLGSGGQFDALKGGRHEPLNKAELIEKSIISIGLVLLGGVFAGCVLPLTGLRALWLPSLSER